MDKQRVIANVSAGILPGGDAKGAVIDDLRKTEAIAERVSADAVIKMIIDELAKKNEIRCGEAELICTLDSTGPQRYSVMIEESNLDSGTKTRNFVVRVTDADLLNKTGGIIQGMSGSPLIQNGKLIGAVTHVLVKDPTRGYGIFIENMLETAQIR